MGLLGFQNKPVSEPEIVDFGGLNGPKPVRNPFKMVGRFAPRHFELVLDRFRAVWTTKIEDFRSRNLPILQTQQPQVQTYLLQVRQ